MKLLHKEIEHCGECPYIRCDEAEGFGCEYKGGRVDMSSKEIPAWCPLPDVPDHIGEVNEMVKGDAVQELCDKIGDREPTSDECKAIADAAGIDAVALHKRMMETIDNAVKSAKKEK